MSAQRALRAAPLLLGAALILLGAGAIILSSSYDAPVETTVLDRNVPVNAGARRAADIRAHNSPAIARNPTDETNLVVANRIDSPRYSCALHVSSDAGRSWAQRPIPYPPGKAPKCYAPDVAFGSGGRLYLSYATLEGRGNSPGDVWLATSGDGGMTFSGPARTPLGENAFQVRLSADPAQPHRLYLTWLAASDVGLYKFTKPGNPIQVIRSEDGGRTWTRPVRVSDSRRERVVAPSPAVGPGGELYVLYLDLGEDRLDYEGGHGGQGGPPYDGPWRLVLGRSTDKGQAWTESVVAKTLVPTERLIAFIPPFPSLAVDAGSGRLYAGFQDGRLGDADVMVWSLPPRGSEWEGPSRVNDTPRRDGTAQYLPKLGVAPDGRVDVVYYDRRADSGDLLNEVSLQSSADHGATFTKRVRLSDRPFSSRIGFGSERGLPDLGSRLGLISTDSRAYAVWTDTRGGTPASGKQDLARSVVAFTDPPRLAGWLEAVLRWGGAAMIAFGAVTLLLAGLSGRQPRWLQS